jgi:hypothetical protein
MIKYTISFFCVWLLLLGDHQSYAKTYKVNNIIDLQGRSWTLSKNDILLFEGQGKLSNGVVVGDNTIIRANKTEVFSNVILKGTFKSEAAFSEWFGIKSDCALSDNKAFVSGTDYTLEFNNLFLFDNVAIAPGTYMVRGGLRCRDNQTINGNGATLKSLNKGICIKIDGGKSDPIRNVKIKNLNIVGGKIDFDDITEFWDGIEIGYAKDVVIEGVSVEYCRGDGFYIGTGIGKVRDKRIPQNIKLVNIRAYHNHRQGLSITRAKGVLIKNSEFCYTEGMPPQRGIDIEPNCRQCEDGSWNVGICENIVIDSCLFKGNAVAGLVLFKVPDPISQYSYIIKNVTIKNSSFDDDDIFIEGGKNIRLENLTLLNSVIGIIEKSAVKNLTIYNINMEEKRWINGRNAIELDYTRGGALRKRIRIDKVQIKGYGGAGIIMKSCEDGSVPQYSNVSISNCIIKNCRKGIVNRSGISSYKENNNQVDTYDVTEYCIGSLFLFGYIGMRARKKKSKSKYIVNN